MEWESLSIDDTEALRQAVAGKNVIGILSGHIHFDRVSNWYGIPVVVGIGQHAATDVTVAARGPAHAVEGASYRHRHPAVFGTLHHLRAAAGEAVANCTVSASPAWPKC
jgi:hypothetical protein